MAEHSASTAIPPIDLEGFRAVMRAASIEEIVEPTLEIFITESEKLVEAMEQALWQGDFDAVRRAAHTLKGSAGNIHARSLAKVAESMETIAEHQDLVAATGLWTTVRREHAEVIRFLAERGTQP